MSDRFNTLTVILEKDFRDDDLQPLIDSICMLRGVLAASAEPADPTSYMAETRALAKLRAKVLDAIRP